MDPGNSAWYIWVFYSVPILRVIEHDFTGSAPALSINLEEDGALGFGDANLVLIDEAFDDEWIKEGAQEGDEMRVSVEADRTGDQIVGDCAESLWFCLGMKRHLLISPVWAGFLVWMVGEELLWGVVVAAAGLMVAAANRLVQHCSILIHIADKAMRLSAVGASETGTHPAVLL